ncbi:glycerol-3-phosphate dehydrogenase/oxidase [Aquirufa rosea]|uniref:Glycerol-3-phosphate dehydrogenase n=1 Tax=Aquirufa rosea TaxID=2509241 RepID=A0A4Q1BZS9_9BACT|nr:FAD-dependent oxidoreductase [Aquirufa rosea]RXK49609.1 FAD-dependent oxidoreductase [Aquirufa rosea]
MAFSRLDQFQKIKANEAKYDICIIGGGATGAGVALDAVLRGYKVLLIEKGDFAGQTSSKSTKLVHGGVRYLEQAVRNLDWQQFKMVYKALHERKVMLQNAPYLAHPLALLTPCYSWWDRVYYGVGMWLYDRISGVTNLKSSQGLGKKQMEQLVPNLQVKSMSGGILYYDGQLNDARYALAILQSAEKEGAAILNYCELSHFTLSPKSLKIKRIHFKDLVAGEEYEVDCKVVINATGPFTDHIRQLANLKLKPRMKVSRGAHIVLPKSFWPGETALLIPKTDDGRVVFVIPWREYILVGTTDEPDELTENPPIKEEEEDYLLDYFNRFALQKASKSDICSGFVGQRPLLQVGLSDAMQSDTKSLVRDHEVEVDQRSKLVSIMGGKWTTYRVMAEDTMDVVEEEVLHRKRQPCRTKDYALFGAEPVDELKWQQRILDLQVGQESARHLREIYGSHAWDVLAYCESSTGGLDLIHSSLPYLQGELNYLKNFEMVECWEDILYRRWGISLRDQAKGQLIKDIKKEAFASFI